MNITTDACDNLDESQKHYAEGKQTDSKSYILDDSMCTTCWERQNQRETEQASVLPGDGDGAENKEAAQRNVGDNGNVLFLYVFVGGSDSMNLSNLRTVL